jgi:hypothetical protein
MDIKHEIVSFESASGSIVVRYWTDQFPDGLTYSIDLPVENGAFPSETRIHELIEAHSPVGQIRRFVEARTADVPTFLRDLAGSSPADAMLDRASAMRLTRNRLLSESDWSQLPDAPLGELERAAWAEYRQALRDLPNQAGFPSDVAWPLSPESEPR